MKFKDFILLKEESNKDWKKEHIQLEKGFVPPTKMRPIIKAFLNSGDIEVMKDTTKEINMPKKSLYLTGGSVRDFLRGKSVKDYHLVTNATPEQIAFILHKGGFRQSPEAENAKMKLVFTPKPATGDDLKVWTVGGTDKKGKPCSIKAIVKGEEFELSTFRKGPKTGKGVDNAEFSDNAVDDCDGRDFTINAMYLELTKDDGENNKLYDPSKKGYHDTTNGVVRTNGKAKERFSEDPGRLLRAIRFQSRFGNSSKMDDDIENSVKNFSDLDGVKLEEIRDEFLKALLHPDTNIRRLAKMYDRTGVIQKLLPGVKINSNIPKVFSSKADKSLAIAWMLHENPIEKVADALATHREGNKTGWNDEERRAILFLVALLEFAPEQRPDFLDAWKGTGLSKNQIKDWVEMFNIKDSKGRIRNRRPMWALHVRTFADNDQPLARSEELGNMGFPHEMSPCALKQLETERFMDLLPRLSGLD